jgi:hypothetical protein
MKKAIILSIASLTISSTLSYGSGYILFDTYDADYGYGIITTYGDGPLVGQGLGNTFTGVLLYSENPITEAATTPATLSSPLNPGLSVAVTGTFDTPYWLVAGYMYSTAFYYSGSQTTLYCEVAAFNGTSYDSSSIKGHSASFTVYSNTGINPPNADQLDNMQPFQVFTVPEPAILCLGGLGLSTLVFLRRKYESGSPV